MSSYVKGVAWQGQPLPRGRHKLDPETVRGSQRGRICRAMLEVVAEHGYEAATVSQVVSAARVSRNAFYEFFTDKTDCFLTVSAELNDELLELVLAAGAEQQHGAFARAYFTGYAELGARAVAQRQAAYEPFVAMFAELGRRAREEQPELGPLPPIVPRALVFAITEIVSDEIRAGRGDSLPALADQLILLIVRLLADEATARTVVV